MRDVSFSGICPNYQYSGKLFFFNYRNFKYGRSIVMISVNLLEGFLIDQIRRFGAATSGLYFTFENVSRSWCNGSRGDEM